jgi:hypothetical protein
MQEEAQALCDFVRREIFPSRLVLSLDVHSGYAGKDRIWFPYAKSRRMIPHVAQAVQLKRLLDRTYPNHRYVFEPQALHYTTHGDLWDHLYDCYRAERPDGLFLPLTLELGTSSWLRKNPTQALSALGFFHPMKAHRVVRVLRRHGPLFAFLSRALYSPDSWAYPDESEIESLKQAALAQWPLHG